MVRSIEIFVLAFLLAGCALRLDPLSSSVPTPPPPQISTPVPVIPIPPPRILTLNEMVAQTFELEKEALALYEAIVGYYGITSQGDFVYWASKLTRYYKEWDKEIPFWDYFYEKGGKEIEEKRNIRKELIQEDLFEPIKPLYEMRLKLQKAREKHER